MGIALRAIVVAFITSTTLACSAGSEGTTSEALQSDELPAYGMNYGGVDINSIDVSQLADANMALERAWLPVVADVHAYDDLVYRAAKTNVSIVPIVFGYWPGGYTAANRGDWRVKGTQVASDMMRVYFADKGKKGVTDPLATKSR